MPATVQGPRSHSPCSLRKHIPAQHLHTAGKCSNSRTAHHDCDVPMRWTCMESWKTRVWPTVRQDVYAPVQACNHVTANMRWKHESERGSPSALYLGHNLREKPWMTATWETQRRSQPQCSRILRSCCEAMQRKVVSGGIPGRGCGRSGETRRAA